MGKELLSVVRMANTCTVCSEETVQTIAWLVDHDTLACRYCGGPIDLNIEKIRATITHLYDACMRFPGLTDNES